MSRVLKSDYPGKWRGPGCELRSQAKRYIVSHSVRSFIYPFFRFHPASSVFVSFSAPSQQVPEKSHRCTRQEVRSLPLWNLYCFSVCCTHLPYGTSTPPDSNSYHSLFIALLCAHFFCEELCFFFCHFYQNRMWLKTLFNLERMVCLLGSFFF